MLSSLALTFTSLLVPAVITSTPSKSAAVLPLISFTEALPAPAICAGILKPEPVPLLLGWLEPAVTPATLTPVIVPDVSAFTFTALAVILPLPFASPATAALVPSCAFSSALNWSLTNLRKSFTSSRVVSFSLFCSSAT